MNKKLTVTVAISAFNEENNIIPFIESAQVQKGDNFIIEKILVINDGSTDHTIKKLKKIKSHKVRIINHAERVGKSTRLNEIYRELKSEILVQSDADVVFSHKYIIRDLVEHFIDDNTVGMCGGRPTPKKSITFTEKAINSTFNIYDRLRPIINGGHNMLSADGRLLAYRKGLIKKIRIPGDMIANDLYTYFCCISEGYKYDFVKTGVVWFRSPQNLHDHLRQNTRFIAARTRMLKYFPESLVKKELRIPKGEFLLSSIQEVLRHPVLCLYIKAINLYISAESTKVEKELNSAWPMAISTKNLY